ncbi:Lon protease C-terminal proteolytic domain-containing protein [Limtongia smithiae]|uniref:Lon protease C-terminal proteolytic domain-containing protein n=1 Tax=Limtongia smithiae TaxID=1125753 RepID=UPI0034CEF7B8
MASRLSSLPLLLLPKTTVLLPGVVMTLAISRHENAALLADVCATAMKPPSLLAATEQQQPTYVGCVTWKASSAAELALVRRSATTEEPPEQDREHADMENSASANPTSLDDEQMFYQYGCAAQIIRVERTTSGTYQVVLEGLSRFQVTEVTQRAPYYTAHVRHMVDTILVASDIPTYTVVAQFKRLARELLTAVKSIATAGISSASTSNSSMPNFVSNLRTLRALESLVNDSGFQDTGKVADFLVFALDAPVADKITILACEDVRARLEKAVELVNQQLNMIKISQKINTSVDSNLNKKQRDFLLRQQLNAIRQELGEKDGDDNEEDDVAELAQKLEDAKLTSDAEKVVQRELKRLKRMHPTQAEYQVCRTYLETIADIPWSVATDDKIDASTLRAAKEQLDHDHYGLETVKRRLLEYLAVVRLKSRGMDHSVIEKAPILLLVGPPGVGKTSLARSVATALGRKFYRISLGGVRDEAEIRGHRRTYVGAMPGLIVQGMRKVGVVNPVFLLDEIDKLGENNFHGDPSAAMLEVLDPEQNHTFTDHYVNIPIDLSKTLFIATANSLDSISAPLLDRMEMISLSGYTYLEKMHIAEQYLVPKQLAANGLKTGQVQLDDDALLKIATSYTREAGVRNLEREIATVCRGKAVEFAESIEDDDALSSGNQHKDFNPVVTVSDVGKYLGMEKYESEIASQDNRPGVVAGLAYMGSGNGGLLYIEATKFPTAGGSGGGGLQLTGNLGAVIKESAMIALTWVRAHGYELQLVASPTESSVAGYDVHMHMPAGAVPKDGPSAGVAMAVSLVSLLSSRAVAPDIAMTGELTLRGQVLPVGGIKEKVLAAHRAGIRKVILPARNRKDVEQDMPANVKKEIAFVFADNLWDVLNEIWPAATRPLAIVESRL